MLTLWLLAKVFASGCTAMTGVEAVSNGVMAFRDPTTANARRTLTIIIALLIVLLLGIAFMCRAYGIGATDPEGSGYQSVLSQLTTAVAGPGIFYYLTIGSILLVLSLSANTAFADFPRLTRAVAGNDPGRAGVTAPVGKPVLKPALGASLIWQRAGGGGVIPG